MSWLRGVAAISGALADVPLAVYLLQLLLEKPPNNPIAFLFYFLLLGGGPVLLIASSWQVWRGRRYFEIVQVCALAVSGLINYIALFIVAIARGAMVWMGSAMVLVAISFVATIALVIARQRSLAAGR